MIDRSPNFFSALETRYKAEIAEAEANIAVYIQNPAGIGEHSDIAEAVEAELDKIAAAQDRIDAIDQHFSSEDQMPLFS